MFPYHSGLVQACLTDGVIKMTKKNCNNDEVEGIQGVHQKQHSVPCYLNIVLNLSLKYAFGIISMFFTLVRCSIVSLSLLLTYCIHVSYFMTEFIAFLYVFSCPMRNVPYQLNT
jgi:hypothetical protein